MQRRNRDINIFNMSALDLFASALGAFILLFVLLMPYYLKTTKSVMQENAQLQGDIRECQAQVSGLKAEVSDLKQQLNDCNQQKQKLQAENDELKQRMKQMQQSLQQAQQSLENKVKFALLGINTQAESFVIVIDMSGSMKAYTKTMKRTLARILEPFESKHTVQIIGFSERGKGNINLISWQSPYNLLAMSDANKDAANAFAAKLANDFDGGTPTKAALLEALKYDAEAIILLTDGAPTQGDRQANTVDIVNTITAQNAGKKEIHTVAIGEYNAAPRLVEFLQQLAGRNRGDFVGAAK